MLLISVENSRAKLFGADAFVLRVLDAELRYPSVSMSGIEKGFIETAWDGWIRLLHIPKQDLPWFPSGLLFRAVEVLQKFQVPHQVVDVRKRPDLGFPEVTVSIPLRDYQDEAVRLAVKAGRGVLSLPPRSGKTRIACELQRHLALPTLWIAPTDAIVRQTQGVIEGFFGGNYVKRLVGSSRWSEVVDVAVVVCTAATAYGLPFDFFRSRKVIIVDEFHHGAAKQYRTIFGQCDHVFYRFGLTGTYFRSGDDALAMHAHISQVIYEMTSEELLRRGYLVPLFGCFLPFEAKRLHGLPVKSFHGGHGKYGIHEHEVRNALVVDAATYLSEAGKRVVVLVGVKSQGDEIERQLLKRFPKQSGTQFCPVEFLSTNRPRYVQQAVLKSFLAHEEVRILIGTSLLGEGVDLPDADALVYARGEKAAVSLTQGIYRVCTAVEGKKYGLVIDFVDRHNRYLKAHALERLRIYWEEPIFDVSVLADMGEFVPWLRKVEAEMSAR